MEGEGVKSKLQTKMKTWRDMVNGCPACGCDQCTEIADNLFCDRCDWNTLEAGLPNQVDLLLAAALKLDWDSDLARLASNECSDDCMTNYGGI